MFHARILGPILGGKHEPVLRNPGIHIHDISWEAYESSWDNYASA
jgi:hypothetical protein